MRTHKAVLWFSLWGALFLSVSSGAVLVARTIGTYSGACEKLDGFPGLLQTAGFVPKGGCKVVGHNRCSNEPCTVDGKKGHCVAVENEDNHGERKCVCRPNKISR